MCIAHTRNTYISSEMFDCKGQQIWFIICFSENISKLKQEIVNSKLLHILFKCSVTKR